MTSRVEAILKYLLGDTATYPNPASHVEDLIVDLGNKYNQDIETLTDRVNDLALGGGGGGTAATKETLGLGNVDNTSDANKPISTAQQAALNLKAPLASPAFSGAPTAPTAIANDRSTRVATMEAAHNVVDEHKLASLSTPTDKVELINTNDDIPSALSKLQFQNGVMLVNSSVGSSTTWVKAATMVTGTTAPMWGLFHARFTGGGTAYTGHYFTDVKMSIGIDKVDGVNTQGLRIMSVVEIVDKNVNDTYFAPEYGYVLNGSTFDIYVKVCKSTSKLIMHPILLDDMIIPNTFETTTTEPTGIVYVDPKIYATKDDLLLKANQTDLDLLIEGLSNVDNTSDANKPVSTAAAAALATKAPLNLSAGFKPAAALASLAPGDSVETALGKLSSNVIRLPAIGGTDVWAKVFDVTPTSFHTFNFTLYEGTIDPIQYIISCYADANTVVTPDKFLQVEKLTRSFYSPNNGARFGYVFDETNRSVQVFIKRAHWGVMTICPSAIRGYDIPSTFESTTTEPAGIVYVEPTTYAPEKLSNTFTPTAALANLAAGDSVETALGKLDAFSYRLYQFQYAGSSNFTWIKLFSTNINNLTSESSNSVSAVEFDVIGSAHPNMGSQMSGFISIQRFGTAGTNTIRRKLFYPYQFDTNQSGTAFTDVGYVLDKTNETWRFEVWIRCGKYADRFLARASFNNTRAVYPDVSTRTTTEPAGIVYVEPTTYAPTASPAFTGTPTVPTAAAGTNTTQAASTEFVQAAINALRAELNP